MTTTAKEYQRLRSHNERMMRGSMRVRSESRDGEEDFKISVRLRCNNKTKEETYPSA